VQKSISTSLSISVIIAFSQTGQSIRNSIPGYSDVVNITVISC
jgi:hypothetical protein